MDFLFRNVYLDIERWLERYGPDTPWDKEVRQVGKYGKAERIVLDAYYEAKAYKALVAHELEMNVVVSFESPKLHRLPDALVNDNEAKHLVRLWRGIIAKRKIEYWTLWAYRNKIPDYSAHAILYSGATTIDRDYRHHMLHADNKPPAEETERYGQYNCSLE